MTGRVPAEGARRARVDKRWSTAALACAFMADSIRNPAGEVTRRGRHFGGRMACGCARPLPVAGLFELDVADDPARVEGDEELLSGEGRLPALLGVRVDEDPLAGGRR